MMRPLTLLALALLPGCVPDPQPMPPRNVMLIAIDTLRADHLSSYGYPRPTSPTIDRLAAEGIRFDRALASAPWSPPSHTSMITGLDPLRHGVSEWGTRTQRGVHPLAQRLLDRGFSTGLFTSHTALAGSVGGLHRGLEEVEIFKNDEDEKTVDAALGFIDAHRDEPFFLWVILMGPHAPYRPPPELARRFSEMPPTVQEKSVPFTKGRHHSFGGIPVKTQIEGQHSVQYYVNLYDAEIAAVDAQLKRLVNRLERNGLLDDTLLIVTSDHGESLGDHDFFGHGVLMRDVVLHVPLIIRHPGSVGAGHSSAALVGLIDIVPTVLDAVGAPGGDELDGISLLSASSSSFRGHEVLYALERRGGERRAMASTASAKWIRDGETGDDLVFDLEADPGEERNLAGTSAARTPAFASLRKALDVYLARPEPERSSFETRKDAEEALRALGYIQ